MIERAGYALPSWRASGSSSGSFHSRGTRLSIVARHPSASRRFSSSSFLFSFFFLFTLPDAPFFLPGILSLFRLGHLVGMPAGWTHSISGRNISGDLRSTMGVENEQRSDLGPKDSFDGYVGRRRPNLTNVWDYCFINLFFIPCKIYLRYIYCAEITWHIISLELPITIHSHHSLASL